MPSAVPMPTSGEAAGPEIRKITVTDLNWALAEGWRDFRDKRGDLILAGFLYPAICIIAVVFTFNDPLLPLLFPLVAGVSIAGPAVAAGFYELARRREEGLDAGWSHFLDPMKGRPRIALATLVLGLAGLFIGWLVAAYAIYVVTFGDAEPLTISHVGRVFTTPQGWALIAFGNLAGLAFAVATLAFSVVSFPLVVDKPVDADLAVSTSLRAFTANLGPVLGWGIRVAALLALGTIPAGIGLAVVLPWLGYSTWHLYTRLVVR